ncbi:hypothetical protein JB92DRAFT_2834203 [Gautieria morchelliformis]|nr:hypothetical protein JB92DRAFT_2834203 [Gautieria morchelliformis]
MLHPPCLCLWPMSLIDFVLCTVLHTGSGQLTYDQSGSVDDSEKDARIAHRSVHAFQRSQKLPSRELGHGTPTLEELSPNSKGPKKEDKREPNQFQLHQWKEESRYGNKEWIDEEISTFESTILDFGPELRTKAP